MRSSRGFVFEPGLELKARVLDRNWVVLGLDGLCSSPTAVWDPSVLCGLSYLTWTSHGYTRDLCVYKTSRTFINIIDLCFLFCLSVFPHVGVNACISLYKTCKKLCK